MIYSHKHVKFAYDGKHNTVTKFQKKFSNINTLEIFVEAEMIQKMIAFSEEALDQLQTLTINGSADMLDVTTIPRNVKTLILKNETSHPPLPANFMSLLPATLQTLVILFEFHGSIEKLPPSLKNLLVNGVRGSINDAWKLNRGLLKVSLDQVLIYSLNISMPPNLTHLRLGPTFDENIDKLESTKITHLALGVKFNQPVNKLPSHLKWVSFGYHFNHPVDHLPSTLEDVLFSLRFNQSIDQLPSSIKYLRIDSRDFQQTVKRWPNLILLSMKTPSCNTSMTSLPETLEIMMVSKSSRDLSKEYNFDKLPKLRRLSISGDYNTSLCAVLPNTVTHLILGDIYNKPLSYLPTSLRYLRIGASFQHMNIGLSSACHLKLVAHPKSIIGRRLSGAASNIFGKDITLKISCDVHDVTKSYGNDPFICKNFVSCDS